MLELREQNDQSHSLSRFSGSEASNIGILGYCPSTGQTGDIDISVKFTPKIINVEFQIKNVKVSVNHI